jgi:polar amino acid transport system substrate-binding protein
MSKTAIFLCLALTCLLTIVAHTSTMAEQAPTLRIIENDWPPYYFNQKPEGLPGFARELLELCLPWQGYRTEFTFYPVKRMYTYLEKGELDIALFSYRKSRESLVHYGQEPLFASGYRPVVRAGSGIEIRDIDDFDDLRIGHLAGLRYSKSFLAYIEKRRAAGTLITTTTGNSCLRMLVDDMIDIFVDTEDTIRWRAQQMGLSEKIRVLNFDIRTRDYYVTVSKASTRIPDKEGFLQKLDGCLQAIKQDGRYTRIAAKYGK